MRYKSENRANACDDSVEDKSGQPFGSFGGFKPVADDNGDTRNPNAEFGRIIGLALILFKGLGG